MKKKSNMTKKIHLAYSLLDSILSEKTKTVHIYIWYIVLFVLFSIIFFLNLKTHLIGDDFVYSFIYQTQIPLSSISDIIESQKIHYNIWGGRSVVHFIAQALLLIKTPWVIDLLNSCAFIALILVCYYHILGKKGYNIGLLLILFFAIWFLQPSFAETTLWITGSANYLWGTLIILAYLLPFRLYKGAGSSAYTAISISLIMFTLGVIAGWTNENTAAALIVMISLFIIYYKKQTIAIPYWAISGIIGVFIGYILMIAAPGNFARAQGTSINPFLVCYRILTYTQRFIYYLGLLNLASVICLILFMQFTTKAKKKILIYSFIFFIGTLTSVYIMVVSPGFPPRTWFGSIVFNLISFGFLFNNLNYELSFLRQIRNSILLFATLGFGFTLYDAISDVSEIDQIWKERMAEIKQKKEEGAKLISFKEYQAKTKFGLGDASYTQKYISTYFDIEIELNKE